ncbi:hypothetical protein SNE40_011104 [Patella caerulea]|uniref:G patch domain-containing protein 11 n=1 Tax=Patella caerulea TaxID=87958 RepID=A0AAN8PTG6_PATCE
MADDEDDYMSDAILKQCDDKADKDIRLLPAKVTRQYQQEKKRKELKQKNFVKPKKVIEQEKRDEGLSKSSLTSDNKGFGLLQKMGFKPGMVLGKHGTGRAEPVEINLKLGRGGLGQEAEKKRKQNEKVARWTEMNMKRKKMESKNQENFKKQMKDKFVNTEAERDLRKSQKVCEQLDSEKGIQEPSEIFFWPKEILEERKKKEKKAMEIEEGYSFELEDELDEDDDEDGDDEDDDSSLSASDKLEVLTVYLRNNHLYCIWCGTRYDDKNDMKSNCPGNTAEDHD